MAEDERLSAALRLNLTPDELAQLRVIAEREDRSVASVARRAVRDLLDANEPTEEVPNDPLGTPVG